MADNWWENAPLATPVDPNAAPQDGTAVTLTHHSQPQDNWWEAAPVSKPAHLDQSYLAGLARTVLGQGTAFGFGDEITAGARSLMGENYDDALKDERAKVAQFEDENPVTATLGEIGGSLVTPGLGLIGGAGKATTMAGKIINGLRKATTIEKAAPTVLGRVAQGAKLGAGLGGAYGFATSEGGDGNIVEQFGNRLKGAAQGAAGGAVTGGVLPLATGLAGGAIQRARDAVSPTLTRLKSGPEAAADEIIANRLRRADVAPQDIAADLQAGQDATKFKSSSATLPEMIADTSPSMQKLSGSVYRSGNEANKIATEALETRQGGDPAQGLFGKAKNTDAPGNQYERIVDDFKRAYSVKSKDFARQAASIKNEQAVLGNQSYQKAFANQQDFEQPLSNVLTSWNLKVRDEPGVPEQKALQTALNLFRRPDKSLTSQALSNRLDDMGNNIDKLVSKANELMTAGKADKANELFDKASRLDRDRDLVHRRLMESYSNIGNQPWPIDTLKRFDAAKRSLDGMIGETTNNNVKRLLVQFKNDALDAIHGGDRSNPTMNLDYSKARDEWGSKAELLDALDAGRKYLGDTTGEVTAQDYAGMTNAQKTMFRLGVTKALEGMLGGKSIGPTADFTSVLRKPNVYQKLREITPQGKTSDNLNELISREARMSSTTRKVTGNSATAERLNEDAEFNGRDILGAAIEKFRSRPTLINLGLDAVRAASEAAFGFRDDVSTALARRLFTANSQEQQAILSRLQQRLGKQKTDKFLAAIDKGALAVGAGAATQAGRTSGEHPQGISGGMGPRYDASANYDPYGMNGR